MKAVSGIRDSPPERCVGVLHGDVVDVSRALDALGSSGEKPHALLGQRAKEAARRMIALAGGASWPGKQGAYAPVGRALARPVPRFPF